MQNARGRWWAWRIAALGGLIAIPSLAEPKAADRAAAEALFEEGLQLLEKKDFVAACPKLESSQKLDPGVGTLLYLADCYEQAGRTASAWATFKEAAYAAETQKQSDRQRTAEEHAAALKSKLSYLQITLAEPVPSGLQVTMDDSAVNNGMLQTAIPMDPGQHRIQAVAPEHVPWSTTVTIPQGPATAKTIVPPLKQAVVAGPVAAPTPPPTRQSPPRPAAPAQATTSPERDQGSDAAPGSTQRFWGYVLGGTGLLGLGVSGVASIMALSKDKAADKECDPKQPTLCNSRGIELSNSAKGAAGVATLAGAIGAAALGTGVVLLLTAPKANSPKTARLMLESTAGPDRGVLWLKGVF
jgi:hypothetical protein